MAALNFVAAPDGLEEDPKLQMLARILKVSRPMAFWFVMRWQRLILRSGNHLSGALPKNYKADDIAAFLEFPGGGQRLVAAMKRQGYLGYKRGRGFYYVGWPETITGRYASRREEDRLWHEKSRRRERATKGRPPAAVLRLADNVARPSDDVVRLTDDASADRPATSPRSSTGKNEGIKSDGPPDPPPEGGASTAEARWAWLNAKAPTPQNRHACMRILATMCESDWALVQAAYGRLDNPSSISRRNRRVLEWPTDQFLRKQGYLRFQDKPRPTRTAGRQGKPGFEADPLAEIEKRILARDKFLAELHLDPEAPEEKKRLAREHWLADPENRDRQPPWEALPEAQNGTAVHPPLREQALPLAATK